MIAAPVHLSGERLMLDPSGALFWPARQLLAVSDLHLEKGTSYAARGSLLPPWDTHVTLERLAALLHRWRPSTVVALGDSFHDAAGAGRLSGGDLARLAAMTAATPFVWVLGNHDPQPQGLAGTYVETFAAGPLVFRHQAAGGGRARGGSEVCGHHHPKAQAAVRGGSISRPCFVTDGARLMLPAFGAYAGGLDVSAPAIARLFPRGGRAFLLGRDRLFSFPLGARNALAASAAQD
jgi:DNA ligase-associated metallophosphoesterase